MNPEALRRKLPGMPGSFYRAPKPVIPRRRLDFEQISRSTAQLLWTRMLIEMVSREAVSR